MAALTSVEIFACMADNFREAAERCQLLAWGSNPLRGRVYLALLGNLKAVEGCCRQAGVHREDGRWYHLGVMIGQLQKEVSRWVHGARTMRERVWAKETFRQLADQLRGLQREAEDTRDKATGRVGMILPKPLEGPHRDTRPVQVLLPDGRPWVH